MPRSYVAVEPLGNAGFCRVDLGARDADLSRSAELEQFETALAATTAHGKVLVECDSPITLPPSCLADICHFYRISQIWRRHGAPSLTFLSPAPIVPLILRTLGIGYTSV